MGNRGIKSETECFAWAATQINTSRTPAPVQCNLTWWEPLWLCLPQMEPGEFIDQSCPVKPGFDPSRTIHMECGKDGGWGSMLNVTQFCISDFHKLVVSRIFGDLNKGELISIARITRKMETIMLCVSIATLIISILIFTCVRSLRCDRNKLHTNLFVAVLVHMITSLVRNMSQISKAAASVITTPGSCELVFVLLEYTNTVMFAWMFVEGLYLNRLLAITVFQTKPNYTLYNLIGWGAPLILSVVWTIVNGILNKEVCWSGYQFQPYYWIQHGPRFFLIFINFCFLLNIVRVLITKLRESNSTEIAQLRKAVRAAIVLLPLLGANNVLIMISEPFHSITSYAIYCYISHILSSLQGFLISLIYCFINAEVRTAVLREWDRHWTQWRGKGKYRAARSSTLVSTASLGASARLHNYPARCQSLRSQTIAESLDEALMDSTKYNSRKSVV